MRKSAALLAFTTLAGGAAAIGFLDSGSGHPVLTGADELNAKAVVSLPRPGGAALAATALPVPIGQPVQAYLPRHARAGTSGTPTKHARPAATQSTGTSPTSSGPTAGASPSPTQPAPSASSTPTAPAGNTGSCSRPSFTTSANFGSENLGSYTVANNMWNVGGGGITQTLSACSASSWFVNATVANDGGGVKTYPNSHYTLNNSPQVSSLNSVTSTFAQSSPNAGTFEDAYDIWLNGLAGSGGADEVMIWTENHGQIPGGSPMASAIFGGQSFTVWRGNNNLVSFVADSTMTSGTLNLVPFLQWLIDKGWEPGNSTLLQVDYGVELVSTNGRETFGFSDFSVNPG
jgi:hypothetical protein